MLLLGLLLIYIIYLCCGFHRLGSRQNGLVGLHWRLASDDFVHRTPAERDSVHCDSTSLAGKASTDISLLANPCWCLGDDPRHNRRKNLKLLISVLRSVETQWHSGLLQFGCDLQHLIIA